MDSLNLPSILSPDLGLLFWMLIAFLVVFGILAKFGFPVITSMVEERKNFIDESLTNARVTNEKLATLKAESEKILKEAHEQQAAILREAKTTGDKIIADAQRKAHEEGAKILEETKLQIQAERERALQDIKGVVSQLSIAISEKVMRQNLTTTQAHEDYINSLLDEIQPSKD